MTETLRLAKAKRDSKRVLRLAVFVAEVADVFGYKLRMCCNFCGATLPLDFDFVWRHHELLHEDELTRFTQGEDV
jgi:hypothetical protein